MKEEYKVGEISRLFGVPIQTLHFFEKCGFISPAKDKQNQYRYYNAGDVNALLDSKYLHSLLFSNAEIEQIMNKDELDTITQRLDNQEKRILDIIYHQQEVLRELNDKKRLLLSLADQSGKFKEIIRPHLYFNVYRKNDSYLLDEEKNWKSKVKHWLPFQPFIKATFLIPFEGIQMGTIETTTHLWGFSVSPERAKEMQIPIEFPVEYIPCKKSIYTVFVAKGEETFLSALYEKALRPIMEQGYHISDAPVGRLLIRFHEDKECIRYFEVWVPIDS